MYWRWTTWSSSRAPRADLAHKFINFMLDGKNATEISNLIGATNPNKAAEAYFLPGVKEPDHFAEHCARTLHPAEGSGYHRPARPEPALVATEAGTLISHSHEAFGALSKQLIVSNLNKDKAQKISSANFF